MTFIYKLRLIIVLLFLSIFNYSISLAQDDFLDTTDVSGFRASRVMPGEFPIAQYWSETAHVIAEKFENAVPGGVWIVSTYYSNGVCKLHFPHPGNDVTYENIQFSSTDKNEEYLDLFDQTGVKVWLQVEPGDANIDTLIHLVMRQYHHHTSVIGFGVDVEWLEPGTDNNWEGRKVTSGEAVTWQYLVKTYNSDYTLFLKHWLSGKFACLSDIVYVDDSQDVASLDAMAAEFAEWGEAFSGNPVIFQVGYDSDVDNDGDCDKDWWGEYTDPVQTIGERLQADIDNYAGIFWVDFTIKDVFPVDDILIAESSNILQNIHLLQNYPNPFNKGTIIKFNLSVKQTIELSIFNMLGKKAQTLYNGEVEAGQYKLAYTPTDNLPSGMYFCRLITENFTRVHKIVYLK